jgi:hypothetical protein
MRIQPLTLPAPAKSLTNYERRRLLNVQKISGGPAIYYETILIRGGDAVPAKFYRLEICRVSCIFEAAFPVVRAFCA